MSSFRNPNRQMDFLIGYRLANGARKFQADANSATSAFCNNTKLSDLKSDVRKMKKV